MEPSRRPERHVYAVTAKGTEELNRWLAEPVAHHQRPRQELLLKLFFGASVPHEITLGRVARHRHEVEALLATYGDIETELLGDSVADAGARPFWLATLRYGQLTAQATLRWCNETADVIGNLPPRADLRGRAALPGDGG